MMHNLDSVSQLANTMYHKGLGAIPETKAFNSVTDYTSPDQLRDLTLENLKTTSNINDLAKPGSIREPDFNRSDSYYFLKRQIRESEEVSRQSNSSSFKVEMIRRDFPILRQKINGKPLIWFDNAATTQKPQVVMDTLQQFYSECNSNIHRGVHTLATKATNAYETAREKVQHLLGAACPSEIVFVRGTTEAINLVAQTYGRMILGGGDEIVLTTMEHHSNIVPWQMLREQTGAIFRIVPITKQGEIRLGDYEKLLSRRTRIVALAHVSNVLGTINPVRTMIEMAHYYGACVLIDGAQSAPHLPVNVREMDADFYAFSGHKNYGPTGIGVLYGKKSLLEAMPPWQGGGNMIKKVTFAETTYDTVPHKFEAGTGNIAGAVGLGVAVDYLQKIGLAHVERYEKEITAYAMSELAKIRGLHLIGTPQLKTSVISFLVDGISPEDLARDLDRQGIATRTGHHCAQPLMQYYGIEGTIRASLGIYNTKEEIDVLTETIRKSIKNI